MPEIARFQGIIIRMYAEPVMNMNPMKHGIYRVVSFDVMRPFTLRVAFDDGTVQVIDFSPILEGDLYGPLRDLSLFNQVQLDREVHTLVWPNGADFDPATLHDWPENLPAMTAMAQRWTIPPSN